MAVADLAALAVLVGIVLAAVVLAGRPLLARLAARNIRRRTSRVLIVLAGLLVGTAVISSSLVVGDTLSYIFLEDVYVRLGAIDEIVSNEFNGQLISFSEANATQVAADLAVWRTPIDGLAPTLLKVMPVRNVAGNKGNQQITVMGLDASRETAFGPLTARDGSSVTTDSLNASAVYANERAAADLNATVGQQLTLFYGTTNQTLVHATVAAIVRDEGTAAYEHRSLLFMDLRRAQVAFNESDAINQMRISNIGGVADGLGVADNVTTNLRLSIAIHHLDLRVHSVKADGIAQAVQIGRDATELFLVMGAFGILAGILLIVNIFVMLAEERKPELGIARALGFLRKDLLATFALEGTFYAVVAAALGSLAGVGLGYVMVYFFDKLVPHGQVPVTFHFDPSSVLTAFVAGTALTWATILVASWRVSRLNIVRAIRDLPEPGTRERSRDALAAGLLAAAAGLALTAWGFLANTGLGKIPGPPLLSLGLGIAVASRGHARAALTIASAFNLVWILVPVGLLNQQTDNVSIAFVMTGIILVGSAILIAVFNVSEALRSLLRRANRGRGRPVLSTAVSYPAEKRFRTGMTVAMFALILFMVTLISMVQGLQASSLDTFVRQQSGGYDVIAYTTSYGEIPNFRQILRENFTDLDGTLLGGENGVSSASVLPAKVETAGGNRSYDYTLWGIDNFLIRSNGYGFTSFLPSFVNESTGRSESLTDRTQVWLSLRYNHTLAIVDRTAAGPNQFVPDSSRLRVVPGDRIRAFDAMGRSVNLTIVGVLEQALQFTSGVFVDQDVVRAVFPAQERYTAYFFQMAPTADVGAFRANLERVFFAYGLQTIDIREEIGRAFDASQQVLTLMEAYLGIGLLVGIAGLAVITLRAVVERRTQIGALRAIGFTRRMVLFVFLLEIALIAVLGIGIGVGLGIVFAYKIWAVYFADIIVFRIPWDHLLLIVGIASVAAVASTAQPAVRASRIPPAEALRYIE
ncbi:MAG: FtsX-like permease family protein [Methanobacteriota archaeon]|nr:MAG: FtsX-like permease family protein [Euryarchaeota archaeon]